jgi:hypothetical protein
MLLYFCMLLMNTHTSCSLTSIAFWLADLRCETNLTLLGAGAFRGLVDVHALVQYARLLQDGWRFFLLSNFLRC